MRPSGGRLPLRDLWLSRTTARTCSSMRVFYKPGRASGSVVRSLLELFGEEPKDAPPHVLGAGLVVSETGDVEQRRERSDVEAVQKAVPGARVLFDVMADAALRERGRQPRRLALELAVPRTIARDDGARPVEHRQVLRQPAIVRGGDREVAVSGHQRETTTHAEADHANPAGARWVGRKPAARGVDVVVHDAGAAHKGGKD